MSYEQNTLDMVSVIFAAGDSKLLNVSGNYFELIDCPDPVDVILSDAVGAQRVRMKQGEASFYSKGVSFSVVQITSATAQTVRFIYGTGEAGTRRSTGSVVISGPVALDAATLAALEQINVRPESGTVFTNNAALTSNTPITVFTPGANLNGAIVQAANIGWQDTSLAVHAFVSKTSPPSSVYDGRPVLRCGPTSVNGGATSWLGHNSLNKDISIPAGEGLYFISTTGLVAGTPNGRDCIYKFL